MDPQLIARAREGDERAFAELTSAIGARLHRAAHGILRDRDLAEDAMQTALVRIWKSLPTLRDPARFEAWATKILVHACYNEARRAKRALPTILGGNDAAGSPELDAVIDRDQLERAMQRLNLEQRTVIVLRLYLDLSVEDTAAALGVPSGTVRSRLNRALSAMRASLEADARALGPISEGGAAR